MDKKPTDKDKDTLLILYNYMKLTKPNVDVDISYDDKKKYIFISLATSEYMAIHCIHGELILVVADEVKIPSWLKDIFHLTRVDSSYLRYKLPTGILKYQYRYYMLEVKDKELLK